MQAWCRQRESEPIHGITGGLLLIEPQVVDCLLTNRTLVVGHKQSLERWPCTLQKKHFSASDLCSTTYETLIKVFQKFGLQKESLHKDRQGHLIRRQIGYKDVEADSLEQLYRTQWQRVILIDAHRLSNRESKAFAACMALPGVCRWAITNNPVHNSCQDLLGIFQVIGFQYDATLHYPFDKAFDQLDLDQTIWKALVN